MKHSSVIALVLISALLISDSAHASNRDTIFLVCKGRGSDSASKLYFFLDLKNRKVRLDDTATWDILELEEDRIVFGRRPEAKSGSLWRLSRLSGDLDQELQHSQGISYYHFSCEPTSRKF